MSRCFDRRVPNRRTPSAEVRTALVDAAALVLERDGVAGLTVRAVATEAGVAPMGVYNHLAGKSGLLTAVLERAFDDLTAAVTPAPSTQAEHRLTESGRGYRRFARSHATVYGLMFNSSRDGVDVEVVGPHAASAYQALVDVVTQSQQVGVVRPGDPDELALQIWSAVHGAMSLELNQQPQIDDDAAAAAAYERLLAMISRGVAPDPS